MQSSNFSCNWKFARKISRKPSWLVLATTQPKDRAGGGLFCIMIKWKVKWQTMIVQLWKNISQNSESELSMTLLKHHAEWEIKQHACWLPHSLWKFLQPQVSEFEFCLLSRFGCGFLWAQWWFGGTVLVALHFVLMCQAALCTWWNFNHSVAVLQEKNEMEFKCEFSKKNCVSHFFAIGDQSF